LSRAIDAVSTRDEKEAARAAEREASKAKGKATIEAAKRQAAESRAKTAEKKTQAAEESAARAEAKVKELEREKRVAVSQERREKAHRRMEERVEAAKAAKTRTYVVKSGDSLSKIAKELLGDASRWSEIHEANRDQIANPNLIRVGQELIIP
jgi:nucleoid-associated protein YgaU